MNPINLFVQQSPALCEFATRATKVGCRKFASKTVGPLSAGSSHCFWFYARRHCPHVCPSSPLQRMMISSLIAWRSFTPRIISGRVEAVLIRRVRAAILFSAYRWTTQGKHCFALCGLDCYSAAMATPVSGAPTPPANALRLVYPCCGTAIYRGAQPSTLEIRVPSRHALMMAFWVLAVAVI